MVSTSLITCIPCLVKINLIKFSSQLLHSFRPELDVPCLDFFKSISSKLAQLFALLIFLTSPVFFIQTSSRRMRWSPVLSVTILTACPGCRVVGIWIWLLKESMLSTDILSNRELRLKRLLLQMYKQFVGLGMSADTSEGDGVRRIGIIPSVGVKYLLRSNESNGIH